MTAFSVGAVQDDAELSAFGSAAKQVYNTTDDALRAKWLARAGTENIRVVRDDGVVVGGLILVPMGQWFGGRSVSSTGIAAVAILPEHRARGAATALMRQTVAEMRRAGTALSSLYPATQPLYRAAGYERAGAEYRISIAAGAMDCRDRTLALRPATDADEPALAETYARRAKGCTGNLDRGRYLWERIHRPLAGQAYRYVVEGAQGIEGYVVYSQREPTGDGPMTLWCSDLVALTPAAARRLAIFFADHRSMVGEVAWRGSLGDALLAVLREQSGATTKLTYAWMLRVLDVARALSYRGYGAGVESEVHLDVADELFPENHGRWILRVANGRGEAVRGGRGDLHLDVRGLAALYTGYQSPPELAAAGLVEADDTVLAAASAVFAGPQPWMADHF